MILFDCQEATFHHRLRGFSDSQVLRRLGALAICGCLLAGCATDRKNPPPHGEVYQVPWGAVDVGTWDDDREDIYSDEAIASWGKYVEDFSKQNPGSKIPFRVLTLSGGGSRGAFGAGVLSGWTLAGNRPEFNVVTGVSTGALMATPAFLGPDYDHALALFTNISNEDVYRKQGKLAILNKEGLYDTTPLRELLARHLDKEMIDAVGREFTETGRSLFIGTTNLDAKVFTIWDMGKIASSDRPERYQLYRDVILASASYPIVFPPVYLPVISETDETYYQMHGDGGLRETVFLFDYMGEFLEHLEDLGLDWDRDIDPQVYLLYNGKIFEDQKYLAVDPNTLSVAMRSMYTLMRTSSTSSVFQVWASGLVHGATVYLAFIPEDQEQLPPALDFDTEKMRRLFQLGYKKAITHSAWLERKPPKDLKEYRQSLEFYENINPLNPSIEVDLDRVGLEPAEQ